MFLDVFKIHVPVSTNTVVFQRKRNVVESLCCGLEQLSKTGRAVSTMQQHIFTVFVISPHCLPEGELSEDRVFLAVIAMICRRTKDRWLHGIEESSLSLGLLGGLS